MAQFILMYVVGPGPAPPSLSPEEIQSLVSEYVSWGEKIGAEGRKVSGARLTDVYSDPGRVCTGNGQDFVVTDGPLAETKEVVGGYAVIEAADYDEAASLCKNHPAARIGQIVIRQLF